MRSRELKTLLLKLSKHIVVGLIKTSFGLNGYMETTRHAYSFQKDLDTNKQAGSTNGLKIREGIEED